MMKRITERNIQDVRIVYNHFIPFPGFMAMMLLGRIYARRRYRDLPDGVIRHELIHAAQAQDCGGWIRYYRKYAVYFMKYGYSRNPFEREAYRYMEVAGYLDFRDGNAWEKYSM